ncbi:hypothetical protein CKO15_08455 [Halorhodospira abdelmalekii]|nr:hypothetical protein [Halorhodospira abdelmalekii]
MSSEERRRFSRIAFHTPAQLLPLKEGCREHTVELLDVSLRGALVSLSSGDEPSGDLLDGSCLFALTVALSEHDVIRMEVEPVHWRGKEIGLRCRRIDIDSIMHLRNLIEANLGDPETMHRELTQLIED